MAPPAQSPLLDLFISYAREDATAIRLIERALAGRGKTCWIDEVAGAILPASEHWAAITDAIERCQAFVWTISPHSLASRYCRNELQHAIARGLRLIPVVLSAEPLAEIPPEVMKLDYIFFRQPEEMENAVAEIADALEIDVEWEKQRRLFVLRASTWEEERDPSRLLRARELESALEWRSRLPAHGQIP
ncbi:MAG TPA: toll/interleukin-1 receptor domain-containing protein, partial [Bryobacteraceae bacterium]|nr:toll/interleukin-1 receptor domain-containing protein [Bryobacteraceae bacterium]